MSNQKLFEALERVCGFIALESDMFEIIRAVEADKMPMTETIEQAAESYYCEQSKAYEDGIEPMFDNSRYLVEGFKNGATWQSSQPNPHRITEAHIMYLDFMCGLGQITHSRMVEILNEIAAGKHKERIEI